MRDLTDDNNSGTDESDAFIFNPNLPEPEPEVVLADDGSSPDCESADEESVTEGDLEIGIEQVPVDDEVEDGDLGLLDPANLAPSDRDFAQKFARMSEAWASAELSAGVRARAS